MFVPCAAHALNLVGEKAVNKNAEANAFFDLIECVYSFFVYSPFRQNKLKIVLRDKDEFLLKRSTGTRCGAKNEAIVAIVTFYVKIIELLKSYLDVNQLQTEDNKATAKGFINHFRKFENIFMLKMWRKVLSQFNRVNNSLQKGNLNLSVTDKLYS